MLFLQRFSKETDNERWGYRNPSLEAVGNKVFEGRLG